jgi:hypothetical protein
MGSKSTAAERPRAAAQPGRVAFICILSWLIPGAGHLMQKRREKGLVFLIALPLMFWVGLWLQGRLFPLEWSDPLVFLGAIANRGVAVPFAIAKMMDAGLGTVTAASYEYGNTFLMTAGLLNFLVILDAFDIAMGRKPALGTNERQGVSHASGAGPGAPASERAGGRGGAKPPA